MLYVTRYDFYLPFSAAWTFTASSTCWWCVPLHSIWWKTTLWMWGQNFQHLWYRWDSSGWVLLDTGRLPCELYQWVIVLLRRIRTNLSSCLDVWSYAVWKWRVHPLHHLPLCPPGSGASPAVWAALSLRYRVFGQAKRGQSQCTKPTSGHGSPRPDAHLHVHRWASCKGHQLTQGHCAWPSF